MTSETAARVMVPEKHESEMTEKRPWRIRISWPKAKEWGLNTVRHVREELSQLVINEQVICTVIRADGFVVHLLVSADVGYVGPV
jgi:hypothetical protein